MEQMHALYALLPALASPQAPQHQHVENVFTYQLLTSG
jgi:hypothetical protein